MHLAGTGSPKEIPCFVLLVQTMFWICYCLYENKAVLEPQVSPALAII